MKNAICFMFVNPEHITCDFASKINTHDVYFMIDNNKLNLDDFQIKYPNIKFIQIDDQECKDKGFINANTWGIKKTPTTWDKIFYYFGLINMQYDNVWIVEEDVFIYNVDAFKNIDDKYIEEDLLVNQNISKEENNGWLYWNLGENKINAPLYHSMVCSCRISKKLFDLIRDYAENNKSLFYIEIMVNTIANKNNLLIKCPEELSTIYPKPTHNRYRNFDKNGKMDWITKDLPDKIKKDFMYHPIKNIELHKNWRNYIYL